MIFIFIVSFIFYVYHLAPAITAGDSGELITAAVTTGISHPPGYPVWTVFGKIFSIFPLGNFAYRINLMSAFFSALSLTLVYNIVYSYRKKLITENNDKHLSFYYYDKEKKIKFVKSEIEEKTVAVIATVFIGLALSFFNTSVVAEVFSMNVFFVLILLYFILRVNYLSLNKLYIFVFIIGLSLCNHHTILLILPAMIYYFLKENNIALKNLIPVKYIFTIFFVFILGFSVYFYLYARAVNEPKLNWGAPDNFRRFYNVITRAQYGSTKLHPEEGPVRTFNLVKKQLFLYLDGLFRNTGIILVILTIYIFTKKNDIRILFLFEFILTGVFFFLLANLQPGLQAKATLDRFYVLNILFILIPFFVFNKNKYLTIFLTFIFIFSLNDKILYCSNRNNFTIYHCGKNMLRKIAKDATVILDEDIGDDIAFSMVYLSEVLIYRKDLKFIDSNGNLFKNIYGKNYYNLDKLNMRIVRKPVERELINNSKKPVYIVAVNKDNYQEYPLSISGEIYRIGQYDNKKLYKENIIIPFGISNYSNRYLTYRNRQFLILFDYFEMKYFIEKNIDYNKKLKILLSNGRDFEWLFYNLGSVLTQKNNFDLAEKLYKKALSINPGYPEAFYGLGYLEYIKKNNDKAIEYFEKAIKLKKKFAEAFFNLGVVYSDTGENKKAKELLMKYLELKPDADNRNSVEEWLKLQ